MEARPMKHLIVGDDVESRTKIEALFHEIGHEVISAESFSQAWDNLRTDDEIASLYLDWTIPENDGLALCDKTRRLRRQPYFPIIIIIAPDCRDVVPRALKAGADNFLLNPLDKTFLTAQIQVIERVQKLED